LDMESKQLKEREYMNETTNQTETTTEQATQQQAAAEQPAQKPKKQKVKKLTREAFLVQKFNEGVTDIEELAKLMEAEIVLGNLRTRESLRKIEANSSMWKSQVKWYLHQAKRKGLIAGEVVTRAPRKKKEVAPEVAAETPAVEAPAPQVAAPAVEEEIGTL
jgi:hypothetical protein